MLKLPRPGKLVLSINAAQAFENLMNWIVFPQGLMRWWKVSDISVVHSWSWRCYLNWVSGGSIFDLFRWLVPSSKVGPFKRQSSINYIRWSGSMFVSILVSILLIYGICILHLFISNLIISWHIRWFGLVPFCDCKLAWGHMVHVLVIHSCSIRWQSISVVICFKAPEFLMFEEAPRATVVWSKRCQQQHQLWRVQVLLLIH